MNSQPTAPTSPVNPIVRRINSAVKSAALYERIYKLFKSSSVRFTVAISIANLSGLCVIVTEVELYRRRTIHSPTTFTSVATIERSGCCRSAAVGTQFRESFNTPASRGLI